MYLKRLGCATFIIILLNMINSCGWTSIPWPILMIPSGIIGLVWLYAIIVATILIIKYPDKYK